MREKQRFQDRILQRLDKELGVDAAMQRIPDELLPEEVLPEGSGAMPGPEVERIVRAAVRERPAPRSPLELIQAHRRRKIRRRSIGVLSVLVLAAGLSQLRWGGQHSTKTLAYEKAFEVLFDDSYTEGNQRSAQKEIYIEMFKAVRALRGTKGTGLENASQQALSVIQALTDSPVPPNPGVVVARPSLEDLVGDLESGRGTPQTVARMVELIRAGIYALDLARAKSPRFRQSSDIALRDLLR